MGTELCVLKSIANEKKYNISTIATTVGYRHPFLTKKESDKFIEDCKSRGDSSTEIDEEKVDALIILDR